MTLGPRKIASISQRILAASLPGGLMSYGPGLADMWRRTARVVGKVLTPALAAHRSATADAEAAEDAGARS